MEIQLGDIVRMKKPHPCGGTDWEITRVGADVKLKCLTCGRVVMLERYAFEKRVKKLVRHAEEEEHAGGPC